MAEIYLLTFPNGKRYVGAVCSQSAKSRFASHAYSARRGSNMLVAQAWREMGPPEMRVLARVPDAFWKEEEIRFIKKMKTLSPNGYNVSIGGMTITPQAVAAALIANRGRPKTEADRAGIRKRNAERVWKQESKEKIAAARRANPMSEETKRKIGKAVSGKGNPFYGKRHTEEAKAKMAAARLGKNLSEETKRRMSESHRRRKCQ